MKDIDKELDTPNQGYIKVDLDYAPKTNGKKFAKWCDEHGLTPLNGGRRAWSSNLGTYLRDASGIAYADGEPFIFYEEDLIDIKALIATQINQARIEAVEYYYWRFECNAGVSEMYGWRETLERAKDQTLRHFDELKGE